MTFIRMNDPADLEEVNPIESLQYPGFYHYPEEHRLLVSKDGVIRNSLNGKIIGGFSQPERKGGKTISFSFETSVKTRYLHRIVARTFCGRPSRHLDKDYSLLEVNHIDGVRSNNTHCNLEWVTGAENAMHSHLSGFHSSDTPVLALNVFDGKITRFSSAKQCADRFKIHRATLHKHLKSSNSGRGLKSGHFFKYDDGSEWYIAPKEERFVIGNNRSSVLGPVVVFDGIRSVVFESINKACHFIGLSTASVWRKMKSSRKFEGGGFQITFLSDKVN